MSACRSRTWLSCALFFAAVTLAAAADNNPPAAPIDKLVADALAAWDVPGAAVVIVTRWDDYRRLPELIAQLDRPPLVVDGRRMLERTSVPSYTGIGL